MRILAFECSAKAASVCLAENGQLVSQYFQASALTHSRTLLKMGEDLLNSLELDIKDMDACAVSIGPGSFTGIRIGIAAVKGLCWGAEKPAIGVSTLEAMAMGTLCPVGTVICPSMDARRSEIYNARFLKTEEGLVRLCEDRAIPAGQCALEAKADGRPHLIVGDGWQVAAGAFEDAGVSFSVPPEGWRLQTAWGVALAAMGKSPGDSADLVPVYLRLSQAERERAERLNKESNK
ncbi:MAG: tRNA (adenosine(37)-N6)-threonylcarbamoyltransferase complex dimerization subunit type 1 TsaB [Oscillospiraceae bacterium]|nr:tRNA (adenosine(37)-N6)-threonylcarbamoyltransferase complex dimerization subunit type 1 TsaB [Oscillospiraceae bacterium]